MIGQYEDVSTEAVAPRPLLQRLLVATDGSENGDRAVSYALTLARRNGSAIEFCYAVDRAGAIAECSSIDGSSSMIMPFVDALDETAQAVLAKARDRALAAGLTATTSVLEGRPAGAIVERVKSGGCDAIVLGTQGKHGIERLFLGSTADGVLRRTDVPVFVVPPGARAGDATFDRFLVAVDDSDPSDAAVSFAISFARAAHADLVVCGVADTEYLTRTGASYAFDPNPMLRDLHEAVRSTVENATARARDAGITCEGIVIDGVPATVLPRIADMHQVGAIVIGTHGRRGVRRWLVGSVSESVVQHSDVPVVVVRRTPARA